MNLVEIFTMALNDGRLKGRAEKIVKKILRDYSDKLSGISPNRLRDGLETVIRMTVQQSVGSINAKITVALIILIAAIGFISIIVTLIAGGNVLTPIIASAIFIGGVWIAGRTITKLISRKVSKSVADLVYMAIEPLVAQFDAYIEDVPAEDVTE